MGPGQRPSGFPSIHLVQGRDHREDKVANDQRARDLAARPEQRKSFRVDSNYYTFEFPGYVCTKYNDFFVSLQYPRRQRTVRQHRFDGEGNP